MKTILSLILLCSTLLQAAASQAANEEVQPQNFLPPASSERSPEREPRISRDQATNIARENFPGEVRSIRRDEQNWRVRLDQDGKVSDVLVNSDSGRVSRDDGE
ncbi:MAG: hypothetical protein RLZZ227_1915 [Pseudomonadota bacterium]|jgi:uncharacterized membrane protein YkoI